MKNIEAFPLLEHLLLIRVVPAPDEKFYLVDINITR